MRISRSMSPNNLPDMPQTIYRKAYNVGPWDNYKDPEDRKRPDREEEAHRVALVGRKEVYEKNDDGDWVKKSLTAITSHTATSVWHPEAPRDHESGFRSAHTKTRPGGKKPLCPPPLVLPRRRLGALVPPPGFEM